MAEWSAVRCLREFDSRPSGVKVLFSNTFTRLRVTFSYKSVRVLVAEFCIKVLEWFFQNGFRILDNLA